MIYFYSKIITENILILGFLYFLSSMYFFNIFKYIMNDINRYHIDYLNAKIV